MNVIWLSLNLSTTIQLAETVSVAGKGGSQHGPHWKSFFIEIQRQGIILASVCLCKSTVWKSNVKNAFNHFAHWSEVSLIVQSLTGETHQTHLRFNVSIKHFSIVWCFMWIFEQGWRQITQSHDLQPTTQQFNTRILTYFRREHGFASQIHQHSSMRYVHISA